MPTASAQCDLCQRSWSSKLPFHCVACAQAQVYRPRIQQTLLQLETEGYAKQIEEAADLSKVDTSARKPDLSPEKAAFVVNRAEAEKAQTEVRIWSIRTHTKDLREKTQALRMELDAWKLSISKRRRDLEASKRRLAEEEKVKLALVHTAMERTKSKWEGLHAETVQARVWLCQDVVMLYGLSQRKRRSGTDAGARDVYYIGGLPIFDLRDLNSASPAHLTASTNHLAHLLHLLSHYLAVRLPAEITLPRRDYPHPTIFSPASSYQGRKVPFPGSHNTSATASSHNSPNASRHPTLLDYHRGPLPKPRPLFLTKKLGTLAKDDPIAYGAFVDGMALLAWDVVWLCKTQGLDVSSPTLSDDARRHLSSSSSSSWEEVCAMGKNLWTLLFSFTTPANNNEKPHGNASLGVYSHATRHSFLGSGPVAEAMRTWRLRDPVKVVEKVRGMLLAERTGADWEVVNDEEIADDKEGVGDGIEGDGEQTGGVVMRVKGTDEGATSRREAPIGENIIEEDRVILGEGMGQRARGSTALEPLAPEEEEEEQGEGRPKAASGWMKVRGGRRSGGA